MTIERVAIVGAGTMGGGIAIGCLAAGLETTVIDRTDTAMEALKDRIGRHFDRALAKGRTTVEAAKAARAKLRTTTDPAAAAAADLMIEAVFEDLAVKRELFAQLGSSIAPEAIVATNTSALRVAELAQSVPAPSRFLGLHYFSPAEVNPLVEVVRGPETAPGTVDRALGFLRRTGKTALTCRDANGFVVNRFFCPYTNEAARCIDEGLGTPAQIDHVACVAFGLPLGPFAVMNIIKPRINLNALRNLSALGAFYHPAASMIRVGEAGESWEINENDPDTEAGAREAINDRLAAALMLPVLEAIGEGVAEPNAFDTGARLALRFDTPPVALMHALGRDRVVGLLDPLIARYGARMPEAGLAAVLPA